MENDVTIATTGSGPAAAVPLTGSPRREAREGGFFCPVRGVQDSATQQLSTATARMLAGRLRVVLPLMTVIVGASFVRQAFLQPVGAVVPAICCATLAALSALLWTARQPSHRQLRAFELAGFGALLVGIAANQTVLATAAARTEDLTALRMVLNRAPVAYLVVMLTYAIFIPNSWRRAAAVVGAMGLAPLVVGEGLHVAHPEVAGLIPWSERLEYLSFMFVGLAAASAIVVLGTRTIEGFRRGLAEAEEAGMYQLQGKLGSGGMGEVWRAEHRLLARPAAIKMIRPDLLSGGGDDRAQMAVERFRREARATAALESPHTVQLYDFGITRDGTFFYVMEFLDGYDLASLIERFGPLPPARAVWLLRQAAESLAEAHEHGLVHRDVKPANLHVGRRAGRHDWVRVLDFGLVKTFEREDRDATALTREGVTTGTPAFFPPEMSRGGAAADARSDIYALGAVGFWLLTGQLVFPAASPMDMIVRHIRDQPEPPSKQTEQPIPPGFDELVLRCLAKDPADRPQSMRELIEALDAIDVPQRWNEQRAAEWWSLHAPTPKLDVA